ncbi:hypothetical protein T484DRAFT_1967793 [Baffinella frigidus]|nr:hypothetical protein T484DRAFT_1967793 [Cryptophyta sp. CCMP2293]
MSISRSALSPDRSSGKARFTTMMDLMSQGDDQAFNQYKSKVQMSQLKAAASGDDAALRKENGMELYARHWTAADRPSSSASRTRSAMSKLWSSSPNLIDMARKASSFLSPSEEQPRTPLRATTRRQRASTGITNSHSSARSTDREQSGGRQPPEVATTRSLLHFADVGIGEESPDTSPAAGARLTSMRRNVSWSNFEDVRIIPANGDPH